MTDSLLICPQCGQRLPQKERRTCGSCGKPIARNDKFYFDGSTVRHRCCENPRGYTNKEESGNDNRK